MLEIVEKKSVRRETRRRRTGWGIKVENIFFKSFFTVRDKALEAGLQALRTIL